MDEFEPAVLTEFIGRIYEVAADSDHWGDFLSQLEQIHPDARLDHNVINSPPRLGA